MRIASLSMISVVMLAGLPAVLEAHAGYKGYSGAPGSLGFCASSCHGSGTDVVTITGFPSVYTPNQQYEITITSTNPIKNFNGSCRIGTGSNNAGVITAGTNTQTYNVAVETNGVRFSANDQTYGTFYWTAPPPGTGEVRLYLAFHWGLADGPNLDTFLIATENVAVDEDEIGFEEGLFPTGRPGVFLLRLNPTHRYRTARVLDISGRLVSVLTLPPDETEALVDLSEENPGTYTVCVGNNLVFKAIRR
ncbi:MAG: choice-of-anchor V domain-containing protein [candidate division WOR-3 bacterium]